MDVTIDPDFERSVQAVLDRIASESSRPVVDVVQDLVGIVETRRMLDSRYDDIKSGKVKLLNGEEAFARLHERIEARRNRSA
jgi:hypothetical protein